MTTNPNASPLLELADRCEAASGPDRELDAQIAVGLYPASNYADLGDSHARLCGPGEDCAPGTYWICGISGLSLRTAPDYTGDPTLKRIALIALRQLSKSMTVDIECPDCNGLGLIQGISRNRRSRFVSYDDLSPDDYTHECENCGGSGIIECPEEESAALRAQASETGRG